MSFKLRAGRYTRISKKEFEKYSVSEYTILIGHSCGCAFLVRWLGESRQRIKKLILVAPWKIADKEDKFRPAFYYYPIDETIKSRNCFLSFEKRKGAVHDVL